ncbi:MAG: hypothetical protein ABR548_09420 [Actinomycetota bacterium]|nr:hypothetical protein [Actinomycetota bacterium]
MKGRTAVLAIAAALVALMAQTGAHAEDWPANRQYVAASAGINASVPGVASISEAAGPVDCSTGAGGGCFDTTGHAGHIFTVTAIDDLGGSVGIFAGFDVDGDGCVACKNGSALGQDGDIFFQDADSVTGFVPQGLHDPTLYVFVRVATLNTGDVGTTGTLKIEDGCGGSRECPIDQDKSMGTVCTGQAGTPTGGGSCQQVMYPYAST